MKKCSKDALTRKGEPNTAETGDNPALTACSVYSTMKTEDSTAVLKKTGRVAYNEKEMYGFSDGGCSGSLHAPHNACGRFCGGYLFDS